MATFFRGFESANSYYKSCLKTKAFKLAMSDRSVQYNEISNSGCHNLDYISRNRAQSYIRETQENNPQLRSQSQPSSGPQATRLISPQFSHSFTCVFCSTEMTLKGQEDKTTQFLCCVKPPYLVFQMNHLFSKIVIHNFYKILLSKRGVLAT